MSSTDVWRRAPRDLFDRDQWPHGDPHSDAPIEVLYAAEFAVQVRAFLASSGKRLNDLAAELELSYGELYHAVEGDRWPRFSTVARVEAALHRSITGWAAVQARLHRDRTVGSHCRRAGDR